MHKIAKRANCRRNLRIRFLYIERERETSDLAATSICCFSRAYVWLRDKNELELRPALPPSLFCCEAHATILQFLERSLQFNHCLLVDASSSANTESSLWPANHCLLVPVLKSVKTLMLDDCIFLETKTFSRFLSSAHKKSFITIV